MRLTVKDSDGDGIKLVVPNFLLMNYLGAFLLHRLLKKEKVNIKTRHIHKLMRILKWAKKHHKSFDILEVYSSDGDIVKISL